MLDFIPLWLREVLGLAAVFRIIDMLSPVSGRDKIADYIFGFHNISFNKFEEAVVFSIIQPFKVDGKINSRRVLLFSISSSLVFMTISLILFELQDETSILGFVDKEKPILSALLSVILLICLSFVLLLISISSYPVDYLSVHITDKVFSSAAIDSWPVFVKIFIDISLSTILVGVIGSGMFFALGDFFSNEYDGFVLTVVSASVLAGLACAAVSSSLLSVVMIVSFIAGVIIRFLIYITNINSNIAVYTSAYQSPFCVLGIIFAIFYNVVFYVVGLI